MLLESVHIEVLVEHPVVPAVQGDTVVDGTPKRPTRTEKSSVRSSAYVDIASNVYLLMQFLVPPCVVQLESVCSHVLVALPVGFEKPFPYIIIANTET